MYLNYKSKCRWIAYSHIWVFSPFTEPLATLKYMLLYLTCDYKKNMCIDPEGGGGSSAARMHNDKLKLKKQKYLSKQYFGA